MALEDDKTLKSTLQFKIRFIEDQLVALDHYLPETYEFLMHELDGQKRLLAELEVREFYQSTETSSFVLNGQLKKGLES